MLSRRATRIIATSSLIAAAGVAVGLLWAARRQPSRSPLAAAVPKKTALRIIPPSRSRSFDDEPEPTAVPHVCGYRAAGADDYESIGPDELGAAFLSRATESGSELASGELGAEAELDGFQIATIEDLTGGA